MAVGFAERPGGARHTRTVLRDRRTERSTAPATQGPLLDLYRGEDATSHCERRGLVRTRRQRRSAIEALSRNGTARDDALNTLVVGLRRHHRSREAADAQALPAGASLRHAQTGGVGAPHPRDRYAPRRPGPRHV